MGEAMGGHKGEKMRKNACFHLTYISERFKLNSGNASVDQENEKAHLESVEKAKKLPKVE